MPDLDLVHAGVMCPCSRGPYQMCHATVNKFMKIKIKDVALVLEKFKFFCLLPIPNYNQQMQSFLIYLFVQTLYMFQAVPPPIIRSTQLYIQLQVLSTVMIELNELVINMYIRPQDKMCMVKI